MALKAFHLVCYLAVCFLIQLACSLPEPGSWTFVLNQIPQQTFGVPKSLYKGSTITISVSCSPVSNSVLKIGWLVRQSSCYEEYLDRNLQESFPLYYKCPELTLVSSYSKIRYLQVPEHQYSCHTFDLKATDQSFLVKDTVDGTTCLTKESDGMQQNGNYEEPTVDDLKKGPKSTDAKVDKSKLSAKQKFESIPTPSSQAGSASDESKKAVRRRRDADTEKAPNVTQPVVVPEQSKDHQIVVDQDGVYLLVIFVELSDPDIFNASISVDVKMRNENGFLSAVDWPLLPFYGVMCGLYVVYAIAWLTVSALQWRDLLRIQFWVGGVIFLGLVEKAVFLNEYQSINSTGQTGHTGMLLAEVVSCLKRTLARLLVIIVSLGFGIVKPRLGPALNRIVGVGSLYFLLCTLEGCLRVLKPKNDPSNQTIMAEIPLAVLDSAICWWIFSSLVQTTRTLRLRRNVVKLGLYRHFTNTLIFSVLASVVYMSWSLYNHRLTNCLTDWKELWVDEAYWHLLFSLILMVIMVLWRPTNNNQRYAFTPLLDALDDEEEENLMEKENTALSDVYGTKVRNNSSSGTVIKGGPPQAVGTASSNSRPKEHKEDDDLKWVEDNIPSSLTDTALPSLLDSDEEIMTVRYERNKME